MIVYVESNFLLEIALGQEQMIEAHSILALAEEKKILLIVPAFSLADPYWTLRKNGDTRRKLISEVGKEIRQLSRSVKHSALTPQATDLIVRLGEIESSERISLDDIVGRVSTIAKVVNLDGETIQAAIQDTNDLGLEPQDAFVFGSILADLTTRNSAKDKLFISRDSRAFDDTVIINKLRAQGCKYIASFSNALKFLQSALEKQT